MKSIFLFFFLVFTQILWAQNFTEVPQFAQFEGLGYSSIAFADVDGDDDLDVLITGVNSSGAYISKLYINKGAGQFIEKRDIPFDGVLASSVSFADVDGDGDPDVLITGSNNSIEKIAKLYINDGMGNFTEMVGTPFTGVQLGSIAFADVDGDSDLDVLITGKKSFYGAPISKLYINDGAGYFTEVTGTPFDGVYESSIAFADVDGDNDPDVLITGLNGSGDHISKLYINDGAGNFSEVTGTPFESVWLSSIAFADVDGDDALDVLITGQTRSGAAIAKLYTNDGTGNFSEVMGTPFDGVFSGSIAFADVDGNNAPDALITGFSSSGDLISKLYINDGTGNFSEIMGTPFDGVQRSSIAFADVDGDNAPDVLITGVNKPGASISKLYANDGSGRFTKMGTPFDRVQRSSIAFADVDGNNGPDILITGANSSTLSKLYINDGVGHFTEMMDTPFDGVSSGSIAFADVDGDNAADVLITGKNSSGATISKLYTNDGTGQFTEMMDTPFDGVYESSIAFADVDGNNAPDVLITGENSSGARISKLYTNDGTGNFSEVPGTPFDGVYESSIAFADVNGNNAPDVLITGENSSGARISKLYTNDGTGNFSEVLGTPFDGVYESSIAFADVNGNNAPDVLITGENSSGARISKLYINDGAGQFTERLGTPFDGVQRGSIAFADVDGDNAPDVLITGYNSSADLISKLYINDGAGYFNEFTGTPFDGVWFSSVAFADVDGDNDPDVIITGTNSSRGPISKLYTNDGFINSNDNLMYGSDFGISLYPNPAASNNLSMRFDSSESGFLNLMIYDLNGRLVHQQKDFVRIGEQTISIDIASLSPGSYFIRLSSGKIQGAAMFIVQ